MRPWVTRRLVHVHHEQDEVFVLLAGKARIHLSGRDIEARTGDCTARSEGGASFLSGDFRRWRAVSHDHARRGFRWSRARTRPPGNDRRPAPNPDALRSPKEQEALAQVARKAWRSNSWGRHLAEDVSCLRACGVNMQRATAQREQGHGRLRSALCEARVGATPLTPPTASRARRFPSADSPARRSPAAWPPPFRARRRS